jgi:poly[(R)-3-hydroxyalkanoate] polymerase subunit PhaC
MSPPVSTTGASPTNPRRPERRKSRAPRRLPATKAQQHDIVHDIVLETAVSVAPDASRGQVPADGLPTAAVIDQMWQANPLQKLVPVDWEAITQALSTLGARSMADPVSATTVAAKLTMRLWQEAAETWIGTASRWWGLATPGEDKLGAPEAPTRASQIAFTRCPTRSPFTQSPPVRHRLAHERMAALSRFETSRITC